MIQDKIPFASDNWAVAHPLIMQAVLNANEGFSPSYGSDPWTVQAQNLLQVAFKKKSKAFFIPTGTGSNVLALKLACDRHESVVCTDIAHIHYQESGAAESVVGCKLLTIPHLDGKITPELVLKKLKSERAFGKHSTSARVLSITQPTEVGTVYTLKELQVLSDLCEQENLLLHIDGSRLYNAAVSLKVSLSEMLEHIHVDLLSLGGTKNGLMGAEALLIFNPALEKGSDHLHKQSLQLLSKMRYLSAQYIPYFQTSLWQELATKANDMAQKLAAIIQETPQLSLSYPVQTNQVFFTAPASWISLIQEKVFCYLWDAEKNELRLITSWNTSNEDIENFRNLISSLKNQS